MSDEKFWDDTPKPEPLQLGEQERLNELNTSTSQLGQNETDPPGSQREYLERHINTRTSPEGGEVDLVEPSDDERSQWLEATEAYVSGLEDWTFKLLAQEVVSRTRIQSQQSEIERLTAQKNITVDIGQSLKILQSSPELCNSMNELMFGKDKADLMDKDAAIIDRLQARVKELELLGSEVVRLSSSDSLHAFGSALAYLKEALPPKPGKADE